MDQAGWYYEDVHFGKLYTKCQVLTPGISVYIYTSLLLTKEGTSKYTHIIGQITKNFNK